MAEQNSCWTKSKVAEAARDGAQWLPQRCLNTRRGVVQRVVERKSRGVLSQGRSNGQREVASVVLTLLFSAVQREVMIGGESSR